jgi:hypothetical protein
VTRLRHVDLEQSKVLQRLLWAAERAGRIHPDGHGVWETDNRSVGFYLEHDRGTMDHRRLAAKLEPYRRLRADGGSNYPLLFSFPTRARERHFHRHLTETAQTGHRLADTLATLTIATCARDYVNGPYGAGRSHLASARQRRSPPPPCRAANPARRSEPSQPGSARLGDDLFAEPSQTP